MKKKNILAIVLLFFLFFTFFIGDISYAEGLDLSFLSNKYVSTILLVLGLIFIVIEVFLPSFGIFGVLGIISLILFFVANINAGYADVGTVLVFLFGAVLLIIELFVPSFGIIGISGITLTVVGIVMSSENVTIGIYSLLIAIVFAIISATIMLKLGYKNKVFSKIVLNKELDDKSGYKAGKDYSFLLNKKGFAITDLRPSGQIKIEDVSYDALSQLEYIKKGEEIIVENVEGSKIIVRLVNNK